MIRHIDAIARQKQRDALYVSFKRATTASEISERTLGLDEMEQKFPLIRQNIINWLDAQGICWESCGEFSDVNWMRRYLGDLYVDIAYDTVLPAFQALQAFLECPDGRMRFSDANLMCCSLEHAMQNAAHDEPGFWERWAEGF